MKIERSMSHFSSFLKAKKGDRKSVLNSFPTFVIDDLIEILYNMVYAKEGMSKQKTFNSKERIKLLEHKLPLLKLMETRNKKDKRKIIYNQKGGFVAAILPIALAALGLTNFLT